MADKRLQALACVLILGLAANVALADGDAVRTSGRSAPPGYSVLQDLLGRQLSFVRRNAPAWIREQSSDPADDDDNASSDSLHLAIQTDRNDGLDMVTVRYPLLGRGALRTYAGAGLNRSIYYARDDAAPELISHRHRSRSVGAAAEVGAEYRPSERLVVSADLRWAGLQDDAARVSRDDLLLAADPVSLGVSLGWRFR
jgi:OmpW family